MWLLTTILIMLRIIVNSIDIHCFQTRLLCYFWKMLAYSICLKTSVLIQVCVVAVVTDMKKQTQEGVYLDVAIK